MKIHAEQSLAIIISRKPTKQLLKLQKQCPAIVIPLDFPVCMPISFSFYLQPPPSTEGWIFLCSGLCDYPDIEDTDTAGELLMGRNYNQWPRKS